MFIFAAERKEIEHLKERISSERQIVARQTQILIPQAKKAAALGSFAWTARKFAPLLRPLALTAFQKIVSSRGSSKRRGFGRKAIKYLGIAGAGFAAWKLLTGGGDE